MIQRVFLERVLDIKYILCRRDVETYVNFKVKNLNTGFRLFRAMLQESMSVWIFLFDAYTRYYDAQDRIVHPNL